MTYTK